MNFFKRCWQKRWIRGLAWTAVTLVTLYVLLSAWVNWSGARQWNASQAMLKAEGETTDFRATTNEPVSESENFCAIPLLKNLALVVDHDTNKGAPGENRKRLEALKLPPNDKPQRAQIPRPKLTTAMLGRQTDLKAWAEWLRKDGSLPMPADSGDAARDVLAALSKHDAIVQELAAGLNRPKAQWTPEWKTCELPQLLATILIPHYSTVQGLNQALALRAIAAARTGEATKAHETALIIARLNQACLNDPFLIGLLVGASGTSFLYGTTWELCDAHAGSTGDFAGLEAALASLDFHSSALHAWRGEMAQGVNGLQYIRNLRGNKLGLFEMINNDGVASSSPFGNLVMHMLPLGFFDANAAVLADREFHYLIKPLREPGWRAALQSAQDWEKELIAMKSHMWTHPTYFMTSLIAPTSKSVIARVVYTQVLVNQAVIACALERYHIEKGNYPDSLDVVKLADGKPLPLDVMNDKPMNYRKTADGRYALWSVGFDGKDDSGKRVLDEKKPENTKFHDEKYAGDWVWDFPQK